MTDWDEYAKHGDLRSVIDPADVRGCKNKYINLLHHKILSDNIKESLKGKRVLDLGCGIGRFTEFLQSCGAEVIGVDSCQEMLNLNVNCKTVCAVVNKLPFEDASFDIVLSVGTLQFVDNEMLLDAAKEINRVLVSGGDIYLIEQLSKHGYDDVFPRSLSDYSDVFKNFILQNSRSIIRERDLIVGIVKRNFIPEVFFPLLISYHMFITKNLYLNDFEYIVQFMNFKKRII